MCSLLSHVQFFETPWTIALQAPLSMEFSWQEYRSGLPFPPSGDLPNQGIKPIFLASSALAGRFFTIVLPGKPTHTHTHIYWNIIQPQKRRKFCHLHDKHR